jgi:serine/threonine protein kinase
VFEIPYLLSKYIKGVNLKEFIKKKGPLKWELIFNISGKILSAIDAIHQQGFFYWNVRPEKIIIETDSNTPVFLDADMPEHISSLTDLSGTNVIINKDLYNTLSYLSPFIDRRKERETETASVICLFGVLLYEMATKDVDIRDEFDFFKNLYNKLNTPGFDLKKKNPTLPDGIANIIKKTIAQKPGQGYKNVKEVLNNLREI